MTRIDFKCIEKFGIWNVNLRFSNTALGGDQPPGSNDSGSACGSILDMNEVSQGLPTFSPADIFSCQFSGQILA